MLTYSFERLFCFVAMLFVFAITLAQNDKVQYYEQQPSSEVSHLKNDELIEQHSDPIKNKSVKSSPSDDNSFSKIDDASSEDEEWEQFVEQYTDNIQDSYDLQGSTIEDDLNVLYELYCNKMNINTATDIDLQRIPFLTTIQAKAIRVYVLDHYPLISAGELMPIIELNYITRQWLHLFLRFERPDEVITLRSVTKSVHSDLLLRTDIPLYTQYGYGKCSPEYAEKHKSIIYQGSQPYHSVRWMLRSGEHFDAGFQAEKDRGEKGVDFYSASVGIHNLGILQNAVLGDYHTHFGLGLVVNTNLSFGKSMMINTFDRMNRGFRRHSSTTETGFMRGAAATVEKGKFRVSAFLSSLSVDGTMRTDSSGVSALKTDGLHRTVLEREKRHNLTKNDYGANIGYYGGALHLSLTAVATHYSMPLAPIHNTIASRYRLYYASGSDFQTYSLAYSYRFAKFSFLGETAMDKDMHLATINMLSSRLGSNEFTIIQRAYDWRYVSINGRTFGENSQPQNENGLYIGWKRVFSEDFVVTAYADVCHFKWLRPSTYNSSWCYDFNIQCASNPYSKHNWSVRYRLKFKQTNPVNASTIPANLMFFTRHSLRAQQQFALSPKFTLTGTVDGTLAHSQKIGTKAGLSLGGRFSYYWNDSKRKRRNGPHKMSVSCTYFDTNTNDTRVYAYTPSLPYTFGMGSLSGNGLQTVALAEAQVVRNFALTIRLASVYYFDRSIIGTGANTIPQRHREDISIGIRHRF